jgi:hypothetical protein
MYFLYSDPKNRKVNIDKDDKIFVLIIIVQIILIFKLATSFLVCDHFDYMSFIKSVCLEFLYIDQATLVDKTILIKLTIEQHEHTIQQK